MDRRRSVWRAISRMASYSPIERIHFAAQLRSYQEQGVRFLLSRNAALLADEMGLGKTVKLP